MSELDWQFGQSFGDKTQVEAISEADIISTVEFDHTGNYLATGDKGGRVVIFERSNEGKKRYSDYNFYAEFQSHEAEFDYLKSLEIEEKINQIKWCKRQNSAHFLLSTNDKTVKLWKIYDKKIKAVSHTNLEGGANKSIKQLKIPTLTAVDTVVAATPRRVYSNAHAYHINSISLNSDGETYLSADDLRVNLWNLDISNQSFNVVDIKPENMEELTEVITCAEFHPINCYTFMYSSSKGTIKLADMRDAALCDNHAKTFDEPEDAANKSFFSEIISSISDVKFSRDGRYIMARDYLTLKLWDINMDSRPVRTISIHEHLRSKLCDLYESDSIFDKFGARFSHDGQHLLTGTYDNTFQVYKADGKGSYTLEASKQPVKKKGRMKKGADINPDAIDFTKKVLHMSWHPREDTIAVAASNSLYIYYA